MLYFYYCFPAWASAAFFWLNQVSEKVVHALSFLGFWANYSIYDLVNRDIALLTFKASNEIASNYLHSKISMAKNWHLNNIRRAAINHLHSPRVKTKFGMRTFSKRAPKSWNDLPFETLDTYSLLKLKSSVKEFYHQ